MNGCRSFVIPTYHCASLQTAAHIEFSRFRHRALNEIFRNEHVFELLKTIPGHPVGIHAFFYKKEVYKKVYIKSQKFKKVFIYNSGKF